MYILMWIVHVIVCLFLIIVVLLQSGKAADLAGAFGGMGSQTAFGPRGSATLLSKATTLALAILATKGAASSGSVLERQKAATKSAPAQSGTGKTGGAAIPATPQGNTIPVTLPPKPAEQPAPAPANKK